MLHCIVESLGGEVNTTIVEAKTCRVVCLTSSSEGEARQITKDLAHYLNTPKDHTHTINLFSI